MIKRSLIKNIPFKKFVKISKKKFRNSDSLFRNFCTFFGYFMWVKNNKSENPTSYFVSLINANTFENICFNTKENNSIISEWFNCEDNSIEKIKTELTSNSFFQDDLNIYIFLFFQHLDEKMEKYKMAKKYLFLHKMIFDICRENFPNDINEIMVFLNLIRGEY